MWFRTIPQISNARQDSISAQDTISLVGAMPVTDATVFPRAVMRLLKTAMPVEHCSVFVFRAGLAPTLEYEACASEQATLPREAGATYMDGHYRSDALARFIGNLGQRGEGEILAFEQSHDDIADPWYRQSCYQRCRVIDRLSVIMPAAGPVAAPSVWLALNLYRTQGAEPFSVQELHDAQGLLAVAATAVRTHHLLSSPYAQSSTRSSACSVLSPREAQVADLIVEGLSSREIGARLGILPSTVTTLRRRAYDKLEVANGKALAAKWVGR